MRHFALSFAFAASLAASLLAAGCSGHPEDWEEDAEDALAKAYAEHIDTLNALGVDTEQTPALDRNGKELPSGCNPLGAPPFYAGRVAVGQVYEIYLAGVDYTGAGYENTVYAGFQDGWPTGTGASASVRPIETQGVSVTVETQGVSTDSTATSSPPPTKV